MGPAEFGVLPEEKLLEFLFVHPGKFLQRSE
jgi:hypothetical protein